MGTLTRPFGTGLWDGNRAESYPNVETLGYFRTSLRDNSGGPMQSTRTMAPPSSRRGGVCQRCLAMRSPRLAVKSNNTTIDRAREIMKRFAPFPGG